MITSEEYYNDPKKFGNYQYITLEEIINDFLMSRDSDDYTSTTPRFKVLYQAMKGVREFYFDILQEVRAIELELSPNLNVILPPDFVSYVRISWVDDRGQLHPMAQDNRKSIAQEYLQDDNFAYLFDDEGAVLQGETQLPMDEIQFDEEDEAAIDKDRFEFGNNFEPNKDLSRVFNNGRYRINKSAGVIEFGSDAKGRMIVLEYISDGLYTGVEGNSEQGIKVHKFAEEAISSFIFYQLIKNRRTVPQSEKMRARKESFNNRRIAKQRINGLKKSELSQIFKGSTKWIKDGE